MLHVLVGSNDDDFAAILEADRKRGSVADWVVPKNARIGDPVTIFTRSKGFVCRASVATKPVQGVFGRKEVHRSDVGPVILFPTPVPLAYVRDRLPNWGWATYPRSYTTPPPPIAEALQAALNDFQCDLEPIEAEQACFPEGQPHYAVGLRYERCPEARAACIQHHGPTCAVCGFTYGGVYGPKMDGLIMVHHLNPLATGGETNVDPIKDMRPVCADCHFVIHRRDPPYSIEEVQAMMAEAEAACTEDKQATEDKTNTGG